MQHMFISLGVLEERPRSQKRTSSTSKNIFLQFFLFQWVIFAHIDLIQSDQINGDPHPTLVKTGFYPPWPPCLMKEASVTAVEVDGESEPIMGGGVTSTQTLEQPGRQNNTFLESTIICMYGTGSGTVGPRLFKIQQRRYVSQPGKQ